MKGNIKLALFFVLIIGTLYHSFYVRKVVVGSLLPLQWIFTMSGVFLGQLIKNRRKK